MGKVPDVLFAANSMLETHLKDIAWGEISVGPLELERLLEDRGRPHVLLLASNEAHKVWGEIESLALDAPLFPVIVGDADQITRGASAFLRLAPVVSFPLEGLLETEVRRLLQRPAVLYRDLASVDPSADLLAQNAVCEWIRCSVGIVGLVTVVSNASVQELTEQLEMLRVTAHSTVDRIPAARLSTDDLWTLLLIVAVPWTREELATKELESAILTRFAGDTMGSRKLIMTSDDSVRSLVGPVTGGESGWYPSSDDPLREQLTVVARDQKERDALELLFKKRFSGDDFDHLVGILGRKP